MRKRKEKNKVVVAMSPKQSLQNATGQAGGAKRKKKILVAMSGGVDSSIAAALLKKEGFDVVGVFMKLANLSNFKESEARAEKIAKILKIPFKTLDLRKEFKGKIIKPFLKAYEKGITPNPCVVCNKEIKFKFLLETALKLDADFVATGHYAKIQKRKDKLYLLKGKDENKDQSYFLWKLSQKQLKFILFPVGNHTKDEVKKKAKKLRLPVFDIKESQEICFIQTTIGDFLKDYMKLKPGNIVNINGGVLGRHQGLFFYTIGQRKGIKLPAGPYYVSNKDLKHNILIVTKNEKDLLKKELLVKNVNWILGKSPKLPLRIKAKIRYRHKTALASIYKIKNNKYKIKFKKAQRAITPGQSVAFYQKDELLGGGIIC